MACEFATAQAIRVSNYDDTRVVTYPVALLRGTLQNTALTSVMVTNQSSSRPTQQMPGLVHNGQFRALADLIPGENTLLIEAGPDQLEFTLRYLPQTNSYIVRPVLYTLNNGDTSYSTPLANDPQDWQAKLGTMMKIMQTFTAESMHDQGYPRLTFNLPINAATGAVQTWTLRSEHDATFYYNQTYDRSQLWYEAYGLIPQQIPDNRAKNVVIVAFSDYNLALDYKYAHTALGGGYVGLMGGLSLWACPSSVDEILPTYMDGGTAYPQIQGEDDFVYLAANTIVGAAMHELGHALGRPHEGAFDISIMQRGFDRMYRLFTLREPNGTVWAPDRVGRWWPTSAAAFAGNHEWFAYPPPVATLETISPDPFPEMLDGLNVAFDQSVTGVSVSDFSLTFNGAPVPEFATSAQLGTVNPSTYRLSLGSLAAGEGEYTLTLHAAGSGIANAGGLSLVEDKAETWTRAGSTAPVLDPMTFADLTDSSATLRGRLVTTGGHPTTVQVVWATADAGTSLSTWANVIDLGERSRGTFSTSLSGLQPNTRYYFRAVAVNALGTVWTPSASLLTPQFALVETPAGARVLVPSTDSLGTAWRERVFNDNTWTVGTTGIGYERQSGYESLISLDVESAMYNRNGTIYVRIPFDVEDPTALTSLSLLIKYDDAFVAFINGYEVARSQYVPATLTWNSRATSTRDEAQAVVFQTINISQHRSRIVAGENVLAIHGLNESTTSSDFLLVPELRATRRPPPARLTYDQWIAGFTLPDSTRGADPDGDGADNEREYLAGGHPGVADAAFRVPESSASASTILLRFRAIAWRSYQVQFSPDLFLWQEAGPPTITSYDNPAATWTDDGTHTGGPPLTNTPRFYRIVISPAP
ncbi:MAG: hypothetical protein ACR2OZ_15935 [Verrucomicrobiales bacterium]